MKKRITSLVLAVLCILSLTACSKKVDINKQLDELGVPKITDVVNTSLYEDKAELSVTDDSALAVVGFKYAFSAFYVFDSAEDEKAAQEAYVNFLKDNGYTEVETNFSSEDYIALTKDGCGVTSSYSNQEYNWKNAEGKYIFTVTVTYN